MFRFLLIARWKPWVSICHLSAHESWTWTSWSLGQSLYFSLPWLLAHFAARRQTVCTATHGQCIHRVSKSKTLRKLLSHGTLVLHRNLFLPLTDPFPLLRIPRPSLAHGLPLPPGANGNLTKLLERLEVLINYLVRLFMQSSIEVSRFRHKKIYGQKAVPTCFGTKVVTAKNMLGSEDS